MGTQIRANDRARTGWSMCVFNHMLDGQVCKPSVIQSTCTRVSSINDHHGSNDARPCIVVRFVVGRATDHRIVSDTAFVHAIEEQPLCHWITRLSSH
jgi:hypothetical protein